MSVPHLVKSAATAAAMTPAIVAVDLIAERWWFTAEPTDEELALIDAAAHDLLFILTDEELDSLTEDVDVLSDDESDFLADLIATDESN